MITEFPPYLSPLLAGFPLSGGRVQSISVNPKNRDHVVVATEFGGLWKTENASESGGPSWFHLDLYTVSAMDVAYAPDGNILLATLARDNSLPNGGGIWYSDNGGKKWTQSKGDMPKHKGVPDRKSAYGISFDPYKRNRVYAGTDYGIATSSDNGLNWSHEMLETTLPVQSVLALHGDKCIALSNGSVYLKKGGGSWKRTTERPHDIISVFKNMDVWPAEDGNDKVFIASWWGFGSGNINVNLYEVSFDRWTSIYLPRTPLSSHVRFVRVSRSIVSEAAIDLWVGTDVNLMKATCPDIDSVKKLEASDWKNVGQSPGLHNDSGYLGLDTQRRPVLYGSSGGLFRPTVFEDAEWPSAALSGSGLNSYKITDLAGTTLRDGSRISTSLYFTTDDNGMWASSDGGFSWPNHDSYDSHDLMSRFSLQVIKDASSENDVTVAYRKYGSDSNSNRFASFMLRDERSVLDVDMTGNSLSNMGEAFLISQNNWIRYRPLGNFPQEIYISRNNGSYWIKIAEVWFCWRGTFTVTGIPSNPVIYAPFRGSKSASDIRKASKIKTKTKKVTKSPADVREFIGLLKLTGIFDSKIRKYDEKDLIYLPDNGSLGLRATRFHTQAVYGVDPRDPNYIIAPDIYNHVIKASHDGGVKWTTDRNLTDEVTDYGSLLLYDGDPYHMQVTQISFDPYDSERIVIGTRDAGIIISKNRGTSWTSLPDSKQITYITNFFFRHDKSIIVSSYGRGLWEVDSRYFPIEYYCPADCNMRLPHIPKPLIYETIDWHDKDVFVFMNGRINGLMLSQNEIKRITVTEGTRHKRYPGISMNPQKVNILGSKNGIGFNGLEGCLAAIQEGEIIKGIVLKENRIFAIISGKEEFKEQFDRSA